MNSTTFSNEYNYPPNSTTNQNIELYKKSQIKYNKEPSYQQQQLSLANNLIDDTNNSQNNINIIQSNNLNQSQNQNQLNNDTNILKKNSSVAANDKEDKIADPEVAKFLMEGQNVKVEDNKDENVDDGDSLGGEDEESSDNESNYKDVLLTHYEDVKRIKNKWKVKFKNCVVQKDGQEYICDKIVGEIERDW